MVALRYAQLKEHEISSCDRTFWALWLALTLGLLVTPAWASEASDPGEAAVQQRLLLRVVAPPGVVLDGATAMVERPDGRTIPVRLSDDGTEPGDLSWDGVYVGYSTGVFARYLPVELSVTFPGEARMVVHSGIERIDDAYSAALTWRLVELDGAWYARRTSSTSVGFEEPVNELVGLAASLSWALFLAAYITWLLVRRRADP